MADTLDVVTLAEARAELGGGQDEVLLAVYITSVSRLLDSACGPVVQRAVTGETHDGGMGHILLDNFPVASVTSLVEYQGTSPLTLTAEAASTSPSSGYVADFSTGKVIRRAGKMDWRFYPGRGNVVVSYVAGRYASTATVDPRFKRAAFITLRNLWSREQGMGTVTFGPDGAPLVGATFALPNAAAAFIRDDIRVTGLVG
jgi:hypothetical protein